ncbi:citrate lyase subunit alpha, partial [Escherichia coli]
ANHYEIDANMYASPLSKGAVINQLDTAILSALEVDTDFNVNVITGSDGVIRGASGGHSDTSMACKMSLVIAPLVRGRIPTIV